VFHTATTVVIATTSTEGGDDNRRGRFQTAERRVTARQHPGPPAGQDRGGLRSRVSSADPGANVVSSATLNDFEVCRKDGQILERRGHPDMMNTIRLDERSADEFEATP